VRSTLWYGSTLDASCIAVYYFAFGEEANFDSHVLYILNVVYFVLLAAGSISKKKSDKG
jgi:hypothetical protein